MMRIESSHFGGEVVVIAPQVFEDERGFFLESFHADKFRDLGLPGEFAQDNHSRSRRGVLRGLHFQYAPPMAKIMRVTLGSAFLVAVDLRKGSPTLGQWYGTVLSAENYKMMWAPAYFARGFCVLTDWAEVQYKCTSVYDGATDTSIRFDDPDIGVEWPLREVQVSERDRRAISFADWLASPLSDCFRYDTVSAPAKVHV